MTRASCCRFIRWHSPDHTLEARSAHLIRGLAGSGSDADAICGLVWPYTGMNGPWAGPITHPV